MVRHPNREWPDGKPTDVIRGQSTEFVRASRVLATLAGVIGVVALVGWAIESPAIAGAVLGQSPTPPMTAILIALASASMLSSTGPSSAVRLGRVAAVVVIIGAAVALLSDAFSLTTGLDS